MHAIIGTVTLPGPETEVKCKYVYKKTDIEAL
jgi:hypothetical protein